MKHLFWYLFIFFCLPHFAWAADYVPLIGIPGLEDPANMTLATYINALYTLAITIAAFLAVVKLIFAGVKYIVSDVPPSKVAAKNDIKNSILGLLIVIGAVLILTTINPDLVDLNALGKIEPTITEIQSVEVITTGSDTTTSGGGTVRSTEWKACVEAGHKPLVYSGRNQIFVCCIDATTDPRCVDLFSTEEAGVTTITNVYKDKSEAEAAKEACIGTGSLEQTGSSRSPRYTVTCTQ